MDPFRCGFGRCGYGPADRGWSWLGLVDSIALWLLLIAAVLLVVTLLRRAGGRAAFGVPRTPGTAPTGWTPPVPPHIAQAEATLADRFARGEISAEQYQDQLAVLRGYQPQQAATQAGAASPAAPSGGQYSATPPTTPPGPATNP